jgi:Cu/Ag efflux protein CusF
VNFNQIKVGDKVRSTLAQEVAVAVSKGGAAPSADAGAIMARAPKGGKPGLLIVDTDSVTGQIKSVDAAKGMITLAEADGDTRTFKAGPNVKLSELKAGDDVTASVTQALAIVVEKP